MRPPLQEDITSEVGVFTTVDEARRAVHGLLEAGFTPEHITVICSDETKEQYFREFEHQEPAGTYTAKAAVAGGTIGVTLGGLSTLAVASAAGTLALWAVGPLVGAGLVAGSLIGAMMTRGVEKELANFYQQAVVEGRILVAADHSGPHHEERLLVAARVLRQAGAKPSPLREG